MEITDSFTVGVAADTLWEALTDVERIAPCIPGFTLIAAEDPEYRGRMKVKMGAISVSYDVTIVFVERDREAMRSVLSVSGKERQGAGGMKATVTSSLIPDGASTTACMVTDVTVTGRVAQFGRGIIGDVSAHLTDEFVKCLTGRVLVPVADEASGSPEPTPAGEPELDLGAAMSMPLVRRVVPVALAVGITAAVLARFARRRRRGAVEAA